jgi:hypothetical protein
MRIFAREFLRIGTRVRVRRAVGIVRAAHTRFQFNPGSASTTRLSSFSIVIPSRKRACACLRANVDHTLVSVWKPQNLREDALTDAKVSATPSFNSFAAALDRICISQPIDQMCEQIIP